MPSLLPTVDLDTTPDAEQTGTVKFGRSWKFDFDTGDFISSPTGKTIPADELEAYIEWCQKALYTCRYKHMIYTRGYGNEFEELIGKGLSQAVIESEIERIAIETLMYDQRTLSVDNFTFTWESDAVYFTCDVTSTYKHSFAVGSKVVI